MFANLSDWLLSITGVICLSVIVELIMPDGQMSKYIKSVMSFLVTLIILLPLPKLLKSERDYSNIFNYEDSIVVDENYLYQLNLNKLNSLKEDIEKDIFSNGYGNVEVYISCDIFQQNLSFKAINVDISNLVISQNAEHKDISKIRKDILKIVQKYINIEEEAVLFNE